MNVTNSLTHHLGDMTTEGSERWLGNVDDKDDLQQARLVTCTMLCMVVELQKERGQTLPPTAGWLRRCDGCVTSVWCCALFGPKSRDVGPVAQRARLTFFLSPLDVCATTSGYTAIHSFSNNLSGTLGIIGHAKSAKAWWRHRSKSTARLWLHCGTQSATAQTEGCYTRPNGACRHHSFAITI